jgi:hypothetical protein
MDIMVNLSSNNMEIPISNRAYSKARDTGLILIRPMVTTICMAVTVKIK